MHHNSPHQLHDCFSLSTPTPGLQLLHVLPEVFGTFSNLNDGEISYDICWIGVMSLQPIDPVSDSRVEHRDSSLNGHNYHYLYAVPAGGSYKATVFLVSCYFTLSGAIQPVDKRSRLCDYCTERVVLLTKRLSQIHGWPDCGSAGWRYQIPLLLDMGFRVVVPDMMGYGGTVRSTSSYPIYGCACHLQPFKILPSCTPSYAVGHGRFNTSHWTTARLSLRYRMHPRSRLMTFPFTLTRGLRMILQSLPK